MSLNLKFQELKSSGDEMFNPWIDYELAEQCVKISEVCSVNFYNWMQDNYFQVREGFVSDLNIDKSKRVIITIEKAFEIYKESQK